MCYNDFSMDIMGNGNASFGDLEREKTPPPQPKAPTSVHTAKNAPVPANPSGSVFKAVPANSAPATTESQPPIIDSKEPFKAGQFRKISDVNLTYRISEPPAGSNKAFELVMSKDSNVPEADSSLMEAEKAQLKVGLQHDSIAQDRANRLMKENCIYNDLKTHQKNGEPLPDCAKKFMASHEMRIQALGAKLDKNGKIIVESKPADTTPVATTPVATTPVEEQLPDIPGKPKVNKDDFNKAVAAFRKQLAGAGNDPTKRGQIADEVYKYTEKFNISDAQRAALDGMFE